MAHQTCILFLLTRYSGTSITRTFKGRGNLFEINKGFELSKEISVAKYIRGNEKIVRFSKEFKPKEFELPRLTCIGILQSKRIWDC